MGFLSDVLRGFHSPQQEREGMNEELFNPSVYTKAMDLVRAYILRKSGVMADAQDIFHEGLMIFMRKARKDQFKLTCPPEVYILGICKKLLKRRKSDEVERRPLAGIENVVDDSDDSLEATCRKELLMKLMQKHIKNLSEKCQEVFKYKMEGLTCEEIADIMEMDSEQILRNKTYTCKKRLWKLIQQDPEYRKIFNDD